MAAVVVIAGEGRVRPAAAVLPAAVIAAGAFVTWSPWWRIIAAYLRGQCQQASALPGWSAGRLWHLSLISCCVIAACDAASGPLLILIGLLITGPVCALLTARWTLTAAAGGFAVALGVVLGLPDQIFATLTQYAFLAAVATVGITTAAGAAVLQRQRP